MEYKKTNLKDTIFSREKNKMFSSKAYADVKTRAHLLNAPIFTIKTVQAFVKGITYRKINDWDSKKMISGSRDNIEGGWRKFSLVEIIKFFIISDLRKFGLNIKKIKNILKNISNRPFQISKEGKSYNPPFLKLEYFTFLSWGGYKILLLINEKEDAFFFDEKNMVQSYFYLDKASSPLIILPFFSYIRSMSKKVMEEKLDSTIEGLLEKRITVKERKILNIINIKNYESITIKKQNGEIQTVKAKKIQRGDFSDKEIIDAIKQKDYQNVSVSINDGKKINITREETIKL
jgi:DNA-binding transcriptional MerR regulator